MQAIDVDRQCYYVEINCATVEEAKRRATVLAYLTYDLRAHNFIRLSSATMLANPYLMEKIYASLDRYDIDLIDNEEGGCDLKAVVST